MPNRAPVMLVEDDADTRKLLKQVLADGGYPVVTASDGQQAIDILESGIRPCIIIVDLAMPHVSGHDLLKYMHSDPEFRTIPAIVVSGLPRDQINVVADAILLKPCEPDVLLENVRKLARVD